MTTSPQNATSQPSPWSQKTFSMASIVTETRLPSNDSPGFTLFPRLPIELRFKISDATLEERVIEIGVTPGLEGFDHFFIHTRLPIIFRICQESCNQAFEKHTTVNIPDIPRDKDANSIPWEVLDGKVEEQVYSPLKMLINYDVDTLYLSLIGGSQEVTWRMRFLLGRHVPIDHFIRNIVRPEHMGAEKLRHIALDMHSIRLLPLLAPCRSLEKVYLVEDGRTEALTRDNLPVFLEKTVSFDPHFNMTGKRDRMDKLIREFSKVDEILMRFWKSTEVIPALVRREDD